MHIVNCKISHMIESTDIEFDETGEHQVDVYYFGKPVARSPFHCQVFDRTKISVMNLPNTGAVGKPVEFDSK